MRDKLGIKITIMSKSNLKTTAKLIIFGSGFFKLNIFEFSTLF